MSLLTRLPHPSPASRASFPPVMLREQSNCSWSLVRKTLKKVAYFGRFEEMTDAVAVRDGSGSFTQVETAVTFTKTFLRTITTTAICTFSIKSTFRERCGACRTEWSYIYIYILHWSMSPLLLSFLQRCLEAFRASAPPPSARRSSRRTRGTKTSCRTQSPWTTRRKTATARTWNQLRGEDLSSGTSPTFTSIKPRWTQNTKAPGDLPLFKMSSLDEALQETGSGHDVEFSTN